MQRATTSDPFTQIIRGAFQGRGGDRLIMGLEAYCDESGTHDGSPIMLMGAYVSTEERWKEFRTKWTAMLHQSGLTQLHMTDLIKDEAGPVEWQTAKWAIEIIKSTIELGVCFTFVESDFNDLTTPKLRKELGDSYAFMTQMILGCVGTREELKRFPGDILYFFELGGPRWEKADKILHRVSMHPTQKAQYRYLNHLFETKQKAPPLQAADVLANLVYRSYRDHGDLEYHSLHPLLRMLTDQGRHVVNHFNRQKLNSTILDSIRYNDQREGTNRADRLKGWNP